MSRDTKDEESHLKEILIEKVRERPAIWDLSHSDHMKTTTVVANDWKEIFNDMKNEFREVLDKLDLKEVKSLIKQWQNLRAQYRNVLRSTKGKSGASSSGVYWFNHT